MSPAYLNEETLFALAARGDGSAMMRLAEIACEQYAAGIPEAIGGAEVLMRLAAEQSPIYRGGLAGFLLGRGSLLIAEGERERGASLQLQAVAILKQSVMDNEPDALSALVLTLQGLADEGDEVCAIELNELMAALPPETVVKVNSEVAEAKRHMENAAQH